MHDLAGRLSGRVQVSADALRHYVDPSLIAFGPRVDFGQIVKSYEATPIGPGRLLYLRQSLIGLDIVPACPEDSTTRRERRSGIAQMTRRLQFLEPCAPLLHHSLNLLWRRRLHPIRVAALVDQQKVSHFGTGVDPVWWTPQE